MNEEKTINLAITILKTALQGQEVQITPDQITPELVAAMQRLAQANSGQVAQTAQHLAQALKNEAQLNFLKQALLFIHESKGNSQILYPFFEDNLPYLNLSLAQIMNDWATTELNNPNITPDQARYITGTTANFSSLIAQFPLGSRADNMEIAIVGYQVVMNAFTREAFPQEWATAQNNLAMAYIDRIRGDKVDNLEQAIAHIKQALQVRTREAFPQEWAQTQNNLGESYRNCIHGERVANLEKAIYHYEQALQIYTRETFPQDWANTQNNLVNAYRDRIQGIGLIIRNKPLPIMNKPYKFLLASPFRKHGHR